MCGIDPQQQRFNAELLGVGLNLLSKLVEAELGANSAQSEDVLSVATIAYQQGKITKSQYLRVIDALDEPDWVKNEISPPTHPMVARLIEDARIQGLTRFN